MEGKLNLADILNRAEKVMARSEEIKPINSPNAGVGGMVSERVDRDYSTYDRYEEMHQYQQEPAYNGPKGVGGRNLPSAILDIMKDAPKQEMTMAPSLDLEMQKFLEQKKQNIGQNRVVNESIKPSSDYVLISKEDLKLMINESIQNFMKKYTHKIEEATIKKTIKTILMEQKRGK